MSTAIDDSELLDRYGRYGDQEAFAELVRRHSDWIYPSARRQLRDAHLAEDVTQAVFLLLARKAERISARSNLGGWLFGTLRYCVKEAGRQRSREHEWVKEAAQMKQDSASEANWELISPLLDEAIGRLRRSDREAVLLRFYQRKSLAEVGRVMRVSEEAARKRVDRAVEKLRGMLEKQGVTATSAGLSAVLVGNVVQEVPARVLEGVMAAIGGGGGAAAGGIAQGAARMMVWAKVKLVAAVVAAGFAIVLGFGIALQAGSTRPAAEQAPAAAAKLPAIRAGQNVEVLPGAPKLDEVLLGMRTQEDAVRNVAIEDFETTVFRRKVDVETWERSPEASRGAAWFAGGRGGKMRVNLASWVLPWVATAREQPGAAKTYVDTPWDVSFDGEVYTEVRHASGPLGNVKPEGLAMIASIEPRAAWSANARPETVACLALWYRRSSEGERFSEQLARATRGGRAPVVSRELADGVELLRLTVPGAASIWLDPRKAYALVRIHAEFRDRGRLIAYQREAVTEFTQAAPGLWLPLAGFTEEKDEGDLLMRVEYRAKRVVANDPEFDDSVFRPAIPQGYRITDTRIDPAYRASRQQQEFGAGKSGGLAQEQAARAKEMQDAVYMCLRYATEHRRRWPDSLEEAYADTGRKCENPDRWEYRRPEGSGGKVAVLFEKIPAYAEGELVVFADGYVEFVRDWQRLSEYRGERRRP